MCQAVFQSTLLIYLSHLIFTGNMNTGYFPNPTDEKTESQRDCVQCHTASK